MDLNTEHRQDTSLISNESSLPFIHNPNSFWKSLVFSLIGLGCTFGIVSLLQEHHPLRQTLLRSPISQVCTVGLFWWGFALLWSRGRQAQVEKLHLERLARRITPERVSTLIQKELNDGSVNYDSLRSLLRSYEGSLAGMMGWSTLRSLYLESQTGTVRYEQLVQSIDRSYQQCYERIESDYRGVTAVMWLMPLSGFLGTVIGMSSAIASFDTVIASAGIDLKSLAPAVSGLATAFDTTLVALALVVPLKLAEVIFERKDQLLLERIDQLVGVGLIEGIDLSNLDVLAKTKHAQEQTTLKMALQDLSTIQKEVDTAEQALSRLTTQLQALSTQLHVPLHKLSEQLDTRPIDQEQFTAVLTQIGDQLITALQAQEKARDLSAQRLEQTLQTLIEQNERPLVLSRGEGRS